MKISNIDVVRIQLTHCVTLFFSEAQEPLIATLLFLAYGILTDLLKNKAHFRDWMQNDNKNIDPKNLWSAWNKDWGFYKHARNGIEFIEINDEYKRTISHILFTAIHDYQLLTSQSDVLYKNFKEMELYQIWYYAADFDVSEGKGNFTIKEKSKKVFPDFESFSLQEKKIVGFNKLKTSNFPSSIT